jgi:hypothetical protein
MSWDGPTGDKCPECQNPLVSTTRGGIKCSNKDCSYKIKVENPEKGKKAVDFDDDFVPPLLDEPQYFTYEDEDAGYFPEGFEDVE